MSSIAEVTVRFAGTLLDVAHVRAGEQYRIGTAPGVELPLELAGITSFPIVDASTGTVVVRRPAGTYATRNALPMHEPDARLAPSDHLELWLGNVLVTVELVATPAPLAMSRVDRRPAGYLAGSLVAHLAIWGVAIAVAVPPAPPKPKPQRPLRVARIAPARVVVREPVRQPPPPKPEKSDKPTSKPASKAHAGSSASRHVVEQPPAPKGPPDMFDVAMAEIEKNPQNGPAILGALITKMDVPGQLAHTDPYYDPQAEHEGDFGHDQFKFDPETRPGFDTIKIDKYATISSGAGAGEHYSIQEEHARIHVRLCEDDGCTADGALARDVIDYRLAFKLRQFATCYRPTVPVSDAESTTTFQLVIGANGKVREAHGPGKTGECVAKVASAVMFPTATDETRVSYSVLFVPPYIPKRVPG